MQAMDAVGKALRALIVWAPWIWLAMLALFVGGASLQEGHLPSYADPKQVGAIGALRMPILMALALALASPIVLGAYAFARASFRQRIPLRARHLAANLSGWTSLALVGASDAFGVFAWLLD